jgi:hypothetical protein
LIVANDHETPCFKGVSAFSGTRIGENKYRPNPRKSLRTSAKNAGENAGAVRGPFPDLIVIEAEVGGGFYCWRGYGDDDAIGPFPSRAHALAVASQGRQS